MGSTTANFSDFLLFINLEFLYLSTISLLGLCSVLGFVVKWCSVKPFLRTIKK